MYCKNMFFFSDWYYLASDNPVRFRKNLLEKNTKITMTINEIGDEKLQYDIKK